LVRPGSWGILDATRARIAPAARRRRVSLSGSVPDAQRVPVRSVRMNRVHRICSHHLPAAFAACALALSAVPAAAQPANDLCANAIAMGNSTVAGTTVGATNDFAGT